MSHLIELSLSQRAAACSEFVKLVDAIWRGDLRVPPGITVIAKTDELIELNVQRNSFALEPDAVALLSLRPLRLSPPLLVPVTGVRSLTVERTKTSLRILADSASRKTLAPKEAMRIARKPSLPPGIHHPAALKVTAGGKPREISGGLPSLGKKR